MPGRYAAAGAPLFLVSATSRNARPLASYLGFSCGAYRDYSESVVPDAPQRSRYIGGFARSPAPSEVAQRRSPRSRRRFHRLPHMLLARSVFPAGLPCLMADADADAAALAGSRLKGEGRGRADAAGPRSPTATATCGRRRSVRVIARISADAGATPVPKTRRRFRSSRQSAKVAAYCTCAATAVRRRVRAFAAGCRSSVFPRGGPCRCISTSQSDLPIRERLEPSRRAECLTV